MEKLKQTKHTSFHILFLCGCNTWGLNIQVAFVCFTLAKWFLPYNTSSIHLPLIQLLFVCVCMWYVKRLTC